MLYINNVSLILTFPIQDIYPFCYNLPTLQKYAPERVYSYKPQKQRENGFHISLIRALNPFGMVMYGLEMELFKIIFDILKKRLAYIYIYR